MENVLRPLIVFGGAMVLAFAIAWAMDRLLCRVDARHPETPLWGLLRRGRVPFQAVIFVALLNGFYDQADITARGQSTVDLWLRIILIGATAWLALRLLAAVVETTTVRYSGAAPDPARARRVKTQLTLIQRLVTAVVIVIGAAAILLQFPAMRTLGTSMLASAGVLGIVAGIAAQSTLGNLFAGLSIAFGDMVRIGDEVVVDGEAGIVDEITVSFLVLRTWDERRITMPVSYFTSKPFENWSRGGPQLTGTVFLHLDHSRPDGGDAREAARYPAECPAWDGRACGLDVTDTTPEHHAGEGPGDCQDADDIWTVRVAVREQMIRWLSEEHLYALSRVNTADAGACLRGVCSSQSALLDGSGLPPCPRDAANGAQRCANPQFPRSAPPFTWTTCEVTCPAPGDAASAVWRRCPRASRPAVEVSRRAAPAGGIDGAAEDSVSSTYPGATTFAVMPAAPSRARSGRTGAARPWPPPYAPLPGPPEAAIELTNSTRPPGAASRSSGPR